MFLLGSVHSIDFDHLLQTTRRLIELTKRLDHNVQYLANLDLSLELKNQLQLHNNLVE